MRNHKETMVAPFDVKTEYLDTQVIFSFHRLFSRIELLSLVDVFATSSASPIKRDKYFS